MDILYLMIICSVSLAVIFLVIFIISAKKGQFDEDETPALRILLDKDDSDDDDNKSSTNKTEDKSD